MPEKVSICPYCQGTDPHQGPTGCPPIKYPPEYYSVDGYPVEVGTKYWSNDLRVVVITQVAAFSNDYQNGRATQTWHKTNQGSFDTLDGQLQSIGRLVRYYGGKDAEQYPVGTEYADIK